MNARPENLKVLIQKIQWIILGDACSPNPCLNDATCFPNGIGGFQCQCPPGFTGQRCEDRDACASQPCQNLGVCVSSSGDSYVCRCRTGYEGQNCEKSQLNKLLNIMANIL